ncbi:MAG: D-glycero-beta-D-manno-heptose 1-phosphate adenylyltransferase [Lachnospiraceae bacterium]|nr:D-glycero-beta-D-manno-heptose 1-phosphate adenylyltransferase [Lachnospiraceae bacterium]
MSKILVIGDAMLDSYHFGDVKRISPEAPVPVFLETGNNRYSPGGAANVAVNVAAIGDSTSLLAVVGNDEYGRILVSKLNDSGINTENMIIKDGYRTISKLRYIGSGNQQILRVDTEDTSPIPEDIFTEAYERLKTEIPKYSLIILSDYLKGFLTEKITAKVIKLANEYSVPVLVDAKDTNISKYRGAMLLKPNRRELSHLTKMSADTFDDAVAAATVLCKNASCKYVLATLGADGMILCDESGLIKEIKSAASEVYDVTGAGDTSIAYLAAEISKGKDIETAMLIANYAAGIQVSKVGAAVVYPDEVFSAMQGRGLETNACILDQCRDDALALLARVKKSGKKIVFTNGCFDILHSGHISYLRKAKESGDILVVGINSDESVKRLKGEGRPVNDLKDREMVLASLSFVDYVIPFDEDTPKELIDSIIPDVLVKGGDYSVEEIVGADVVTANGGEVKVIDYVPGRSTTGIIEKMRQG